MYFDVTGAQQKYSRARPQVQSEEHWISDEPLFLLP